MVAVRVDGELAVLGDVDVPNGVPPAEGRDVARPRHAAVELPRERRVDHLVVVVERDVGEELDAGDVEEGERQGLGEETEAPRLEDAHGGAEPAPYHTCRRETNPTGGPSGLGPFTRTWWRMRGA